MSEQKFLGVFEEIRPFIDPTKRVEIFVVIVVEEFGFAVLVDNREYLIDTFYEQIQKEDVVAKVVIRVVARCVVTEPFIGNSM